MRKKRNKNYTLYWMTALSAVLTVPIAFVIIRKVTLGIVEQTALIMGAFLILLMAILFLYKMIFGVSVQEITGDEKMTELDRLVMELQEQKRRHSNTQLRKDLDIAMEQAATFRRRQGVLQDLDASADGAFDDLVRSVESALTSNLVRIHGRAEIFDDRGIAQIMKQNLSYMEEILFKNNEILTEFEKLITEISRMGESHESGDVNRIRDVIAAMERLRTDKDDEIDELAKKYENK